MLSEEKAVQTLVNLGLTVLQSRVYLALAKLGTSTVRTAAKASKVPRQDVYRVFSGLQEKGLVEKIISKPNKYRPIPIKKGLTILLQRRNEQTIEIENTKTEILNSFSIIDNTEDSDEKCQFVWIPPKETIGHKLLNEVETAQTYIDLGCDFISAFADEYELARDLMLKSIKRGVKFRALIDLSQGTCKESKAFSILKRNAQFQVRFIYSVLPVKIEIKDRQEVLISTGTAKTNIDTPYLWTNNPIVVQVIQQWYDMMWEKGSKDYPRKQ